MITVCKTDDAYPRRLRELASMPEELYVIGELPDDSQPSVAIVGARMCSGYGRRTAYEFGRILAGKGVQVISGMASGIDSSAQEGALDGGGKSFAVLGGGADVCYPRGNTTLYNRLKEQGGIISEQPAGTAPLSFYFPARNRIISGLSDLVLVVEAKSRSGSLITVDFALTQGRTVYAVPGRVGDALSDGCNYLIAQGAGIAYAPEAILNELQIIADTVSFSAARDRTAAFRRSSVRAVRTSETLSEEEKRIYLALDWENPLYPDALAEKTSIPAGEVRSALGSLKRNGYVTEEGRDQFRRRCPGENTLTTADT
jgi:DNA processing protein